MFEKVIYNRPPIIEYKDGLLNRKFEFQQVYSTIDALDVVLKLVRYAMPSNKKVPW